jgi:hypothetical protein
LKFPLENNGQFAESIAQMRGNVGRGLVDIVI